MGRIEGMTVKERPGPDDVARIIELHRGLYSKEHGFDETFVDHVAVHLSEFADRISDREHLWTVENQGMTVGSIAVVKASETEAQLRWLLLHPDLRGKGVGKELMGMALAFCRQKGYSKVFLWTADVLLEAAGLYRSFGFRVTEEKRHTVWGVHLAEQRYEREL